ncbi:MAG: DNA repair protein RecO [Planctomycetales bacterium 12-60-4]|nr:MAG: DNA repair protein RecO [Planctomycetales bacterium 12-60-4]
MSSEKSDGLILRVTDFSETSRIVVLFTQEFGKISALAKGGRRLKGPFESALDLLANCRVVFLRKVSSGLDLLTEAQLIGRFRPAERDLTCLYAGYYVAELLLGLTEDYDPHPELYQAALEALEAFGHSELVKRALLRFELVLLREIGQLPDFDTCAGCGAPLTEGLVFGFWVSQGGLICPECQREDFSQMAIHAGSAAALRLLSGPGEQAWRRLELSPQQYKEMRRVTTSAISHGLGRRPKLLSYLT